MGVAATETPREHTFCTHALLNPEEPLIVPDASLDSRFANNPYVTGEPKIRFYIGTPLLTPDRQAIGTLCVIDRVPRSLTQEQIGALGVLADQIVAQLELRRHARELQNTAVGRERYLGELERYRRKLEENNALLQHQSTTDRLTGIGNRAAFDQQLQVEQYRAGRYRTALSLLLIGVDHFKAYSDSYGHGAGDAALQQLAGILQECARPTDFVARYGDEEFAVILPQTGRDGATALAERLHKAAAAAVFRHRPVTVSIGAATVTTTGTDSGRLVEAADEALYEAKAGGRNRVVHKDGG